MCPLYEKDLRSRLAKIKSNVASSVPRRKRGNESSSKGTLQTSILVRLRKLEELNKTYVDRIKDQSFQIESLNDEIATLKACATERGAAETIEELKENNRQMKTQIEEMTRFLEGQGLDWIGYGSDESNTVVVPTDPTAKGLLRALETLNDAVGTQKLRDDGSGFDSISIVPITVYRDGMFLFRGPFRSYEDDSTIDFVRQCVRGFVPSEFADDHPNGVRFDVTDRRDVRYAETNDGRNRTKMTKLQFIRRLPKHTVTPSGRILNVREKVAKRTQIDTKEPAPISRDARRADILRALDRRHGSTATRLEKETPVV